MMFSVKMRISSKPLGLTCGVLYQKISSSRKRTFLLIATVLIIFIVFEFVSSSLTRVAAGHHWSGVYVRLLNVPEQVRRSVDNGTSAAESAVGTTSVSDATRTHPTDTRTFPTDTWKHPTDTRTFPTDTRKHPNDTRTFPTDTRKHPNDKRKHPNDTRTFPNDRRTFQTDTWKHPTDTRKHPNDTRKHPNDSTLNCDDLRIGIALIGRVPDSLLKRDPFEWQRVGGRFHETYVFSAYYDDRLSPANRIVIVGISDGYAFREAVSPSREFCQVWYPGGGGAGEEDVYDVVEAEFRVVPDHHSLRFAASLHFCPLTRNDSIPLAVSLIVDRCRQSQNIIRVQNDFGDDDQQTKKRNKKGPEVEFTVCVSPLINSYNDFQQLVENVEVNRIFGADEFIFYNHSTDDGAISPFLHSYLEEGIARAIIPWNIPPVDVHYFGQLAALNDCLYRSMFRSRFIVIADLDELIVPRRHGTWSDMLDVGEMRREEEKKNPFPAAFIFRSSVFQFRLENNDSAKISSVGKNTTRYVGLRSLMDTVRDSHIFSKNIRSKYIARPVMFLMVGIHFPFDGIPRSVVRKVSMDTDVGLVHHYRRTLLKVNGADGGIVEDASILRFKDLIVSRTEWRHRKVGETRKRFTGKPPITGGTED